MNKASITIGMLLVAALAMKATGAEMLFHASFDRTAVALTVSGEVEPLEMEGLEFAEGDKSSFVDAFSLVKIEPQGLLLLFKWRYA